MPRIILHLFFDQGKRSGRVNRVEDTGYTHNNSCIRWNEFIRGKYFKILQSHSNFKVSFSIENCVRVKIGN